MVHYGYIKEKFKELQTCAPADVSKHCMAIMENYILIEKAEQKQFAEEFYKWAEEHSAQKPLLFCYAKFTKAFDLFYREKYDEGFPLLIEAQNLFAEQNDLDAAALCMTVQGGIYRTFGNFDLALKSLWAGHERLKKAPLFQHFLFACEINIGNIYVEMKHYDEAIPLFKSTLEIAEPKEKYYWTIYALHGLSKIYLAQNKFPEAKECVEKALTVAEKFKNPTSLCNSLSETGNYYFAAEQFQEAEQFHKQSLVLREKNQFTGGAVTSCIRLGEIFIKDSKPDEAIEVLGKGLILAEQLKVKPKMYQIHLLLSEIYKSKNDLEKSLFHFKQFHELREQVEVEDSARKLKNVQMVFEAEQTKKENIIIKQQKEEIERKNIELQETIDELTRARIGKKARVFTLAIAIALFIIEDTILHYALSVTGDGYFLSLVVKMVIIFSLSPINKAIENYLLRKVIKKEKKNVLV